jgi:hypothetical protein
MVATLKICSKNPEPKQNSTKHVATENHQTTKEHSREEERNKYLQNNHKTISKVVVVSSYLSLITLIINK